MCVMADLTVSTPSDIKICNVKSRLSPLTTHEYSADSEDHELPSSTPLA